MKNIDSLLLSVSSWLSVFCGYGISSWIMNCVCEPIFSSIDSIIFRYDHSASIVGFCFISVAGHVLCHVVSSWTHTLIQRLSSSSSRHRSWVSERVILRSAILSVSRSSPCCCPPNRRRAWSSTPCSPRLTSRLVLQLPWALLAYMCVVAWVSYADWARSEPCGDLVLGSGNCGVACWIFVSCVIAKLHSIHIFKCKTSCL